MELPENWKNIDEFDIKPILIQENGRDFVLMGTKHDHSFYFDVVFIGTAEASQKYNYCLSFTSGNRVRKKHFCGHEPLVHIPYNSICFGRH